MAACAECLVHPEFFLFFLAVLRGLVSLVELFFLFVAPGGTLPVVVSLDATGVAFAWLLAAFARHPDELCARRGLQRPEFQECVTLRLAKETGFA